MHETHHQPKLKHTKEGKIEENRPKKLGKKEKQETEDMDKEKRGDQEPHLREIEGERNLTLSCWIWMLYLQIDRKKETMPSPIVL